MNGGDTVCEGYFYKNVMTFYAAFLRWNMKIIDV